MSWSQIAAHPLTDSPGCWTCWVTCFLVSAHFTKKSNLPFCTWQQGLYKHILKAKAGKTVSTTPQSCWGNLLLDNEVAASVRFRRSGCC